MDLIDVVDGLMEDCDPDGPTFRKLAKIRSVLERGVMVGPGAMRFLREIQTKVDNVECQHLRRNDRCSFPGIQLCEHVSAFRRCPQYVAVRGTVRGDPLANIGG